MKTIKPEPTIKRSRAAELLDKTPRTLVRYEAAGLLDPIHLNCRSVVYRMTQVQSLLSGNIKTPARKTQAMQRAADGQFKAEAA